MDQYGIGSAMQAMQAMYVNTARRAGRTTRMLERLKDGDRVLCSNQGAARDIKNRARGMGLDVQTIHISDFHGMAQMRPAEGKTYMDHTMVERLYELAILGTQKEIDAWLDAMNHGKDQAPQPFSLGFEG